MFYLKNISTLERAARVGLGLLCLLLAWSNPGGSVLMLAAWISGAIMALTGLAGFCPMCALLGRKIKR